MFQYTQRIFFEILFNQTDIRLYLPVSNWFGTKRTSVSFQINRNMVNIIWFQVGLIRFGKYFSVCILCRLGSFGVAPCYGSGLFRGGSCYRPRGQRSVSEILCSSIYIHKSWASIKFLFALCLFVYFCFIFNFNTFYFLYK